jgi:hypothetical protein
LSIVANRSPISSYRPPIRSRDLPLPPRWTPREKAIAERRLTQFVVLSILLHTVAILLFGAPVGGSREGRAMWGSLNVVIREAVRTAVKPAAPAPAAEVAPRVEAPLPVPAPPTPSAPVVEQAKPTQPPAAEFPPILDRLAPSEMKIDPAVDFKVLPVETPRIPQPVLQPMPTLPERTTLPPIEAPVIRIPAPTPKVPTPLLQPMPTLPERTTLPPVEAPVIRIPTPTPKVPEQLLHPMPSMPERTTLPPVETPVIRTPAPTPSIPEPLLQPIAPLQERSTLPPVERARIETPPASKAPPAEVAPRVPETTRTPAPSTPDTPPRTRAQEPTISYPPADTPSFKTPPPASRDQPAEYDPTKPSLDLDQMRKRAGEITRAGTGNRALLPFPMPPVEKPKSNMEKAIENARKPDCNDAYKSLGLLAVVPLIANEFGEGSCRWR